MRMTAGDLLSGRSDLVTREIYKALQWPNIQGANGLRSAANLVGIPNAERHNANQLYELLTDVRDGIGRLLEVKTRELRLGRRVRVTGTGLRRNFDGVISSISVVGLVHIKGVRGAFNPLSVTVTD